MTSIKEFVILFGVRKGKTLLEEYMKKFLSIALAVVMAAVLTLTASAAFVGNHHFDKTGSVDAGGKTWSVTGWIVTDTDITAIGYVLDGGEYTEAVTGVENDTRAAYTEQKGVTYTYRDLNLEQVCKDGGMYGGIAWDIMRAYRVQLVIDITGLEAGPHTIQVVAKFVDGTTETAFRDKSDFTFNKAAEGEEQQSSTGTSIIYLFDEYEITDTAILAKGWAGANVKTEKLGYKIDNQPTVYNENYVKLIKLDFTKAEDAAVAEYTGPQGFRFSVSLPLAALPLGQHEIRLIMQDKNGGELSISKQGDEEIIIIASGIEGEITEAPVSTEAETAAQETDAVTTSAATEAQTDAETKPAESKGLSGGAIALIIVCVVAVAAVAVTFIVTKKKK